MTVSVLCMKWGTLYGPEYVNNLRRGVARHLSLPHRFICFTDDSSGLDPEVKVFPLPELGLPDGKTDTRWRKLGLFSNDLFGLEGKALFLDLDLVVVGDLDPFFDFGDGIRMIRDDDLFRAKPLRRINADRDAFLHAVGNSSVFGYEIGAHSYILDAYVSDPEAAMQQYEISQQFQSAKLMERGALSYWPSEWCVSFKNHCVPRHFHSFFSDPTLPEGARIVVFAGTPKMDEALRGQGGRWYRRIGPAPWLQEAWQGAVGP